MVLNINAKPGDETRRNGDYVGLAHPDGEVKLSNVTIPKGYPVAYDGTDIQMVTGDSSDAVVGVVSEYDVFGGNQGSGNEQLVRGDRDATIKTRGAVAADLTPYVDGGANVTVGDTLGLNGEIMVLESIEDSDASDTELDDDNLYEVLIR